MRHGSEAICSQSATCVARPAFKGLFTCGAFLEWQPTFVPSLLDPHHDRSSALFVEPQNTLPFVVFNTIVSTVTLLWWKEAHRTYPNPRCWVSSTTSTLHVAGNAVTETTPPNPKSANPPNALQNWSGFPGST